MANDSFETEHATNQGEALDWTREETSSAEGIGVFDADEQTWLAQESFAGKWRIPFVVHGQADTANVVTTPNATDLTTANALANALRAAYNEHVLLSANIHLMIDLLHPITAVEAVNGGTLILLVNDLKAKLNLHMMWTSAHAKQDVPTQVSTVDATNQSTAEDLANALKVAFNDHLDNIGAFGYAEDSVFTFTDTMLSAGIMAASGLDYEDFENGWAIPDMVDSEKIEQQTHQVTAYPVPVHPLTNWPVGHVQFLDVFEHVPNELGMTEAHEQNWFLPGTEASATNDRYYYRYFKDGAWVFTDEQLKLGIEDTFNEGWDANDVWKDAYWSGTEWRFTEIQLELGITEVFDDTDWTLTLD
jgi:hypothetical protein